MKIMTKIAELKKRLTQNPEFRDEYEKLGAELSADLKTSENRKGGGDYANPMHSSANA